MAKAVFATVNEWVNAPSVTTVYNRQAALSLAAWWLACWRGLRPLAYCCCWPRINVNITLFSHVTLNSKVQSTSDLDYFHARPTLFTCKVSQRSDQQLSSSISLHIIDYFPHTTLYHTSPYPPDIHHLWEPVIIISPTYLPFFSWLHLSVQQPSSQAAMPLDTHIHKSY